MNAPQFFHENLEASKAALAATESSSFFKFEENTISYLYLLPPWSQRGLLARLVKECFLGKRHGRYTCWQTYETFGHPELGRKDPVTQVIFDAYAAMGKPDNIKKMLPSNRWYANVIVDGTSKLDKQSGAELDGYAQNAEPKQQIVGFTDALWRELDKLRHAQGVGCIYDPSAATCIIVKRDDTKDITKYTLALAGSRSAGTFVPEKRNLFERFEQTAPGKGAATLTEILGALTDLDAKWPLPNEAAFAEASVLASALQAELTGGGAPSAAPGFGPPGGFGMPSSGVPGVTLPQGGPAPVSFVPPSAPPPQALMGMPSQGMAPTVPGAPGIAGPPLRTAPPGAPIGPVPTFLPPGIPR